MKIFLGTDHAGFKLKEIVKNFLIEKDFDIEDCGALNFDKEDDYPDYIYSAAKKTSENKNSIAIVFGKSGAGEVIVANKIKGIRAILGFSKENVELSRLHNDANVLSIGSEFTNEHLAKDLVNIFIGTKFSNEEKHVRRLNKIKEIENGIN